MALPIGINRQQRAPGSINKEAAQAFDPRAFAHWHLAASYPVDYVASGDEFGPFVANDAADPNTAAPADARILPCGQPSATVSHIAIWPIITQALEIHVWCRTGLTTTGAEWVRTAKINFLATTADLETFVPVNYRDVFIQIVSGADGAHPVTLAVAAC